MIPRETTTRVLGMGAALLALLGTAAPSHAQLAASAWPMFQHDVQHTGRSPFSGPVNIPSVCWEYSGGGRRAAPSLGVDGTVYLTVGRRPIVALDPSDGSELWPDAGAPVAIADRSQPAVAADGTIYMGSRNNALWAFEPDGDNKWQFQVFTDGDVSTPPTIGPDNTVYMGSDSLGAGRLFAINPNGTEKWMTILGGGLKQVSPALSHDNETIYVTTSGRTLFAVEADTGDILWEKHVVASSTGSRAPNFSPVIGADGTIYFAVRTGVFAFDPDGNELWNFQPALHRFNSAPALGADGTVYVGGWTLTGADFYALNGATGAVKWSQQTISGGKFRNNQAVVGADGTIYVGHNRFLYAFEPADGEIRWVLPLSGSFKASVIIGGPGLIYAGAGTRLFALSDQPCP